ncbi:response regulator transcription factor [Lachnospiraceae bacterium MD329]|jgi:DNA-binding LytR/AlgR family response regulator|nr:response regulator transcription factor [Lachnospiraceae bacterium MD329]
MEEHSMRIAICDDDKLCIKNTEQYLNCISEVDFEYDIFYSGEDLLKKYRDQSYIYDAIFLDMEMGEGKIDGINIANMIRTMDKQTIIVFITNHKKYALDSFVCTPFRFLVKPVDFESFKTLFFMILEKLEEDKATLSFKKGREKIRLLHEDILFLQSIDHNTCIQTKNKVYDTYISLSDFSNKLNPNIFVQIHRSYIININYISSISKNEVHIRGYSHSIPISNTYRKNFERKVFLLEEKERLL